MLPASAVAVAADAAAADVGHTRAYSNGFVKASDCDGSASQPVQTIREHHSRTAAKLPPKPLRLAGDGEQATSEAVGSPPHPFLYELHATRLDRVIFFFMLVLVAPVRIVLIVVCLIVAWLLSCVTLIGVPLVPEEPLSSWRKVTKSAVVVVVRLLWFFAGVHYVTVKGTRSSSKEAPLLVMAPHSSHIDTLTGTVCGFPGVISTVENGRLPLIGKIFRVNESVFVSRSDPNSRQLAVREVQRRACSGGKWPQLVVFPEGTCTNRKCLLPFKTGAFMPGVPVQPVCVRYPGRLDLSSWINVGPGLVTMFMFHLSYPHTPLEIEFLPVYYPSDEEKKDARLYADNVRNLLSKELGIPLTHHTYEDLMELQKRFKNTRPSPLAIWRDLLLRGSIVMPRELLQAQ